MAGSIFCKKKKGQKKEKRPPPPPPRLPGVLTMYNIARRWSIEKGAVASQFLHLDWDLFSFFVSLEASISGIKKKHGYLLWQCHVSLNKKTVKIKFAFVVFLPLCKLSRWSRNQCMVTSKSIYFLEKKIKYDHENRHTFNYIKNKSASTQPARFPHSLNA